MRYICGLGIYAITSTVAPFGIFITWSCVVQEQSARAIAYGGPTDIFSGELED
jgi:hypothetical protein